MLLELLWGLALMTDLMTSGCQDLGGCSRRLLLDAHVQR
jgi:hypothetical protein